MERDPFGPMPIDNNDPTDIVAQIPEKIAVLSEAETDATLKEMEAAIAKARAMARAAANRWAVEPEKRQEDAKAENVDADTAHGRQLDSVGPTSATPAAPAAYEPEKRQEPVTAHPAQIDAGSGDVRSDDAPEPDGPPAAPVVPLAVARESDERDILLAAIRHMVIGADPKKLIEVAAQCGHKSWAGLSRSLGEMKYEHIREIYGLLKL